MKFSQSIVLLLAIMSSSVWADSLKGNFSSLAHPTSGEVRVVRGQGEKRFLLIGNDFKTDKGPALVVVLHKDADPTSYTSENSLNLGPIVEFEGEQAYEIPAEVNLSKLSSVLIWCKRFGVNFGSATLSM